jgi:hypothetical protein
VKRSFVVAPIFLLLACSRLPTLTPAILTEAEEKWAAHRPQAYRLVLEMTGDRVEKGRFEIEMRSGGIVSLRRNGLVVSPNAGQDYTMEGLFRMLTQELGLAEKPAMLGAPPGYKVYTTARFDDATGRLIRYRRIVGGTSNSIEVNVLEYSEGTNGYFSKP